MENVPTQPPVPEAIPNLGCNMPNLGCSAPVYDTLIDVLTAKLDEAKDRQAKAEQAVKDLEVEIAGVPEHLRAMSYAEMIGKVEGWFGATNR